MFDIRWQAQSDFISSSYNATQKEYRLPILSTIELRPVIEPFLSKALNAQFAPGTLGLRITG